MSSFDFLLTLAIILLSTRFLGSLSNRVNMPQVIGALLTGFILGPSIIGHVNETEFLMTTAEIGDSAHTPFEKSYIYLPFCK